MGAESTIQLDDLPLALESATAPLVRVEHAARVDAAAALAGCAQHAAAQGGRVLVACVDEWQAAAFRAGLRDDRQEEALQVATVQQLALDVLRRLGPADAARQPRVLSQNDLAILLEDMKVCGLKPRRLREICKFFFKGMADGDNLQQDWLINAEEQQLHALLQRNLDMRQAYLPCEVAGRAAAALRDAQDVRPYDLVIALDFGAMSKTSQQFLRALPATRFVAAGNASGAKSPQEPYPFPQGFSALADDGAVLLSVDEGQGASAEYHAAPSLDDEAALAARLVAAQLEAGVAPEDVLVAVPNAQGKALLQDAFAKAGIPTCEAAQAAKLKGDPRDSGRCGNLKFATLCALLRDPRDMPALRAWLGYGDWLLRSDAFLELMAYAVDHGMTVQESLDYLRAHDDEAADMVSFSKLRQPFGQLAALQELSAGATAQRARQLLAENDVHLDDALLALLGADDAPANLAAVEQAICKPLQIPQRDASAVRVAPYSRCHGQHARVLVATGLVNGNLPALEAVDDAYSLDHRQRMMARDRVLWEDLRALPTQLFAGTCCSQMPLELSGQLKVQPARVFLKGGQRHATIVPSQFVPLQEWRTN